MQFDPAINKLRQFAENELAGNEISGYAARAAARELLASWEDALADRNTGHLAADVDDVISRLQAFKSMAREQLPVVNGGLEGKTLDDWKQHLASQGVEVYRTPCRDFGWSFTGLSGSDYVEEYLAVIEAVKRYLPAGGYVLTPLQMAKARVHPLARKLGLGWLMLADLNAFGRVVHLVSEHRDRAVAFPCDKPYRGFMRQRAYAVIFAGEAPEKPLMTAAAPAEPISGRS